MQLSLLEPLLGTSTPSVVSGMLRLTVLHCAGTVVLYRAFSVVVGTPAPDISWGLLTVDPDMA
jgi:hypothetical protein